MRKLLRSMRMYEPAVAVPCCLVVLCAASVHMCVFERSGKKSLDVSSIGGEVEHAYREYASKRCLKNSTQVSGSC